MISTKSQGISRGGICASRARRAAAGTTAFEQTANRAARADVHAADFQDRAIFSALLVKIDVVDAHNFAAMHIDHLLIEQIPAEQQQTFGAVGWDPVRGRSQRRDTPPLISETAVRGRTRGFPVAVLTISRSDAGTVLLRGEATSRTRPLAAPEAS